MSDQPRRFPPPWSVDDPDVKLGQDCFIVREQRAGVGLFLFRRGLDKRLTKDEARRMAVNFAKLPELRRLGEGSI